MVNLLTIFQLVFAIGLMAAILLQGREAGLGSFFSGSETYRSKRGVEKILFWATIGLAIGFLLTSILNILV